MSSPPRWPPTTPGAIGDPAPSVGRPSPAFALPDVSGTTGWLTTFAIGEVLDRRAIVRTVIALGALGAVGPLPTLIPPPGSTTPSGSDAAVDDPVLVKVRALLAQAESTTFDAEAAAFTAKAQELMARHAIDAAVLWASSERDERPITIRLPIDDPYADIKALLLHYVARHSRCRAVRHVNYGLMSVVGFASDVVATELLFTSLLVQSQVALQAEGAKAAPGARARSRSFRSSFLLCFTRRVDQRLAEINAAVEGGAADDTRLAAARARRPRQRRRRRRGRDVRRAAPRRGARRLRRRRLGARQAGRRLGAAQPR